jgi:hypothetical protein
MGLKIMVEYQGEPVVYDIVMQEDNVYHLRLGQSQREHGGYIPEKMVIRKKGMVWISDNENYLELVNALTKEISTFSRNKI